jgi:hypothetical protein
MVARARAAVMGSGDLVTDNQVLDLAQSRQFDEKPALRQWLLEGSVFSVMHHGIYYFPRYALDPCREFRPYPSVREIIKVFDADKDGWGLAYWFASANSYLGGMRPQDVLATEPGRVLAAAIDEVRAVTHA